MRNDKHGKRLGTIVMTVLLVLPLTTTSAEAHCQILSNPNHADTLVATPAQQTAPVGARVEITVQGFSCDESDEITGEPIRVHVTGAHNVIAQGVTPFKFTYTGELTGQDVVRFSGPAYPPAHWSSETSATVEWTPSAASIHANGSVFTVTKSSGNPRGGMAVFECDLNAPGAIRVEITSCIAGTVAAPAVAAAGPAAVTLGEFSSDAPDAVNVCWRMVADFPNGSAIATGCETVN